MRTSEHRNQIPIYLLLAFAFSSLFYFLIIKSGHIGSAGGLYVVGLMWSPAIAGIIACLSFGDSLGTLGWKWGKTRYQVMAYLIPLLYATIAYCGVWLSHGGHFYDSAFVERTGQSFGLGPLPSWLTITIYFLLSATAGMVPGCARALGEEIGWRGFLVPHLAKSVSYTKTALISGAVWSVWHYPVLIWADYSSNTSVWYELACFTVMIVSSSFIFAWIRLKSGNLWTCMFLHASHNLFIQRFFDPMTADTGRTRYFTSEFGIALPLVTICFAFYFWTRRHELIAEQPTNDITRQLEAKIVK